MTTVTSSAGARAQLEAELVEDSHPSLLALIVETNPASWKLRSQYGIESMIEANELIAQITLFCHSYALMHRSNRIVVIANHPTESVVVYPRRRTGGAVDDDFIPICHTLQTVVTEGLREYMAKEKSPESSSGSSSSSSNSSNSSSSSKRKAQANDNDSTLSHALSTALCTINRQLQLHPKLQPRIAVLQLTKDQSATYNSVMNSIFSAQKLGVIVDGIVLAREDSRFLQQATLLTGGVYHKPQDQRACLQLMLTHALPSGFQRKLLRAPLQKTIDFRASCFCCRKPVEYAFMCSVCLALTCKQPTDVCATCGTSARITELTR